MSVFDSGDVVFEEVMPDGTTRKGVMRLITPAPVTIISPEEISILRELANAVDSFQMSSKFVAGDFGPVYSSLVKLRKFRASSQP